MHPEWYLNGPPFIIDAGCAVTRGDDAEAANMSKRFAIIGDLIAETIGDEITPGGGGAIALALRNIDGDVTLRSRIGSDDTGDAVMQRLKAARIHPKHIDRIAGATSTLTRNEDGTVSNWVPNVVMTKDGVLDIYDLFAHGALVLDLYDQPLRQFLIDLPAHTDGKVRMLTTLSHLDHLEPQPDELDIAMRADTIVGTEEQFAKLTGESVASNALGLIFERMPLTHLRAAVAITGDGIEIIARDTRVLKPIQDAVPGLLVPQVVAGISWGMATYADWEVAAEVCMDPAAAR